MSLNIYEIFITKKKNLTQDFLLQKYIVNIIYFSNIFTLDSFFSISDIYLFI
jgi:hypothetical protein